MSPFWVKMSRGYRWRKLRRGQQLVDIETQGVEHVRDAIAAGHGVLVAPNHSTHYDSEALYVAFDRISQPVYFMTAWQVFEMSTAFERWLMQRMGCFSIDRESTDRKAFKQAIEVLRNEPHPLVIFPEGDIYHITDRVTTFREGAAAIALSATKRCERPITVIPCAIKFWYLEDPAGRLTSVADRLEAQFHIRPQLGLSLRERIYRLAEALLALKELDYIGHTREGEVRQRINFLTETIVARLENEYALKISGSKVPERVKGLRQSIIKKAEGDLPKNGNRESFYRQLELHMDDLFFVMQLYSYPGDYLNEGASVERIAETLDKLEEDVLGVDLPSVHGRRKVTIRFGAPIPVSTDGEKRRGSGELTQTVQEAVQVLMDELNRSYDSAEN